MADNESTSTPGSSTKGGYKQRGNLNESNQRAKDKAIRDIIANWKITDLDLAFPASIKPNSLGNSALINIKNISRRKGLAEAQALFLKVCKDANGAPVPLGFTHTEKVWLALKDAEVAQANTKVAKKTAIGATEKFMAPKSAAETLKKTTKTGAPKVPHDLIAPGSSIRPPFSLGSSPAGKKGDTNQPPKPTAHTGGVAIPKGSENKPPRVIAHTKGVALPKGTESQPPKSIPHTRGVAIPTKKLQGPEEPSESRAAKATFSGDEAPSPLANKKRPLTTKTADENLQQADLPAFKKARKENETALPELPKSVLAASVAGPSQADILESSVTEDSHAHALSDDGPLAELAELNRLMELNRKENEKIFNSNTPKLAPVTEMKRTENEKLFNANIPKFAATTANENLVTDNGDTIIVDVTGRQARSQSEGQIQTLKVKRTRSASLKSTLGTALAEGQPFEKSKARFDIHHDSNIEQTTSKAIARAPTADMLTKMDDFPLLTGTSSARVPQTQIYNHPEPKQSANILAAVDTASLQINRPDGLREHCSIIRGEMRDVMDPQELSEHASPNQQALVEDLKTVFASTMRHLEADLDWVFKKHGTDSV